MSNQAGKGRTHLQQIRRQRLLTVVAAATPVGPVEHVSGKANIAAPSQLISQKAPTVILRRPLLGGTQFLRFVVPWPNDFFFADVEFCAVVVQQENRREWSLALRDSH